MSSWDNRSQCPKLSEPFAPPRIIRTDSDLLRLIKDRIAELGTTHLCVEHVSGASLGYISKITGENPPKKVGVYIALLLLQALGIQLSDHFS